MARVVAPKKPAPPVQASKTVAPKIAAPKAATPQVVVAKTAPAVAKTAVAKTAAAKPVVAKPVTVEAPKPAVRNETPVKSEPAVAPKPVAAAPKEPAKPASLESLPLPRPPEFATVATETVMSQALTMARAFGALQAKMLEHDCAEFKAKLGEAETHERSRATWRAFTRLTRRGPQAREAPSTKIQAPGETPIAGQGRKPRAKLLPEQFN